MARFKISKHLSLWEKCKFGGVSSYPHNLDKKRSSHQELQERILELMLQSEKSKSLSLASLSAIGIQLSDKNKRSAAYPSNCIHISRKFAKCQESERQVSEISKKDELLIDFRPKKIYSEALARSYMRLAADSDRLNDTLVHKSERVNSCASFLDFASNRISEEEIEDKKYLYKASFCRDRLCPMCEWRRSRKIFSQVLQISERLSQDYKFALLTLTVPNVSAAELPAALDKLFYALKKFVLYAPFKRVVRGFFRRLEITYNNKRQSHSYNTFHPHFHILLVLDKSYGRDDYITRDEWLNLWKTACQDDTITQVDIRMIDTSDMKSEKDKIVSPIAKAVAEVAKYTCKSSDYIFLDDDEKTDFVVSALSKAIKGRRLTAFGGLMKDLFQNLQLQDMESEDADLLSGEKDGLRPECDWIIYSYYWNGTLYDNEKTYLLTVQERQRQKVDKNGSP